MIVQETLTRRWGDSTNKENSILTVADDSELVKTSIVPPNTGEQETYLARLEGLVVANKIGGEQQLTILKALIASSNGLTNYELVKKTGIKMSSVCARVHELRKQGFILCAGCFRVNPESGVKNVVWRVVLEND